MKSVVFFYKLTQSRFVLVVLNGGKRHTSCGPCTSKVLDAMHDARLRALEGSQLEMRYVFARRNEREQYLSHSEVIALPHGFLRRSKSKKNELMARPAAAV